MRAQGGSPKSGPAHPTELIRTLLESRSRFRIQIDLNFLKGQHGKADSTLRTSQAVPHPSTNRALCRLTSEVERDPVHSTRYGRQRTSSFHKPFLEKFDRRHIIDTDVSCQESCCHESSPLVRRSFAARRRSSLVVPASVCICVHASLPMCSFSLRLCPRVYVRSHLQSFRGHQLLFASNANASSWLISLSLRKGQ